MALRATRTPTFLHSIWQAHQKKSLSGPLLRRWQIEKLRIFGDEPARVPPLQALLELHSVRSILSIPILSRAPSLRRTASLSANPSLSVSQEPVQIQASPLRTEGHRLPLAQVVLVHRHLVFLHPLVGQGHRGILLRL